MRKVTIQSSRNRMVTLVLPMLAHTYVGIISTKLYQIRPGVTSYATLYNGYTDTMEKMLRRLDLDLYYLKHRSLWMDFGILFKTFVNIIFGKIF